MGLFDRLEAGLERAVQGTFAKHLRSAVHPVEIASNIRRAMDDRGRHLLRPRDRAERLHHRALAR